LNPQPVTPKKAHTGEIITGVGVVAAAVVTGLFALLGSRGDADDTLPPPRPTVPVTATTGSDWEAKASAVCAKDNPAILAQMQRLGGDSLSSQADIQQYGADLATLGTLTQQLAGDLATVPAPDAKAADIRQALDTISTSAGIMQRVGTFVKTHGSITAADRDEVVSATGQMPAALNSLAVAGATGCSSQ
jgi:hypothetical protein